MPRRIGLKLPTGTLSREITLVLAVKALLLLVLWLLFFSHARVTTPGGAAAAVFGPLPSQSFEQPGGRP